MNWQTINDLNNIETTDDLIVVYGHCSPESLGTLSNYLSESEKIKYKRYRNRTPPECRAVLRILLSKYLNSPPETIEILETKFGKPYIEHKGLFFNVSHTDSSFVIGIGKIGRIGIDIECLSVNEDVKSLTDFTFSEDEKRLYFDPDDEFLSFTKIWTLKEALLKAAGIGLVDRLNELNVHEKLQHYKLNFTTFTCPNNETGSVVYSGMLCQKPGIRYLYLEQVI